MDTESVKTRFAKQLRLSLCMVYGGSLPSLSTIARDLSLRFPHLPHVSTETVRKWLHGSALPQSPRMQALATWLGDDILEVLRAEQVTGGRTTTGRQLGYHEVDSFSHEAEVKSLLASLSPSDLEIMLKLARSLVKKEKTVESALNTVSPIIPEQMKNKGSSVAPNGSFPTDHVKLTPPRAHRLTAKRSKH